jgi:hypothetical protein
MFYKSVQLPAYADDIIGRSEDNIRKTFTALITAANVMGLKSQRGKNKYMTANVNKKHRSAAAIHISISGYKFERVRRFVYLGKESVDDCRMLINITITFKNISNQGSLLVKLNPGYTKL